MSGPDYNEKLQGTLKGEKHRLRDCQPSELESNGAGMLKLRSGIQNNYDLCSEL
jgi:hypothetical protein